MRKKLSSIILAGALALTAVFAFTGTAAAFSSTCGNNAGAGSTLRLMAFESTQYNDGWDFPIAPDDNVLCVYTNPGVGLSISNLKNVAYSITGGNNVCRGQLITSYGSWNDCISSLEWASDCHYTLSMYDDANYVNLVVSVHSNWNIASFGFGYDDIISSIKITYSPVCPNFAQ